MALENLEEVKGKGVYVQGNDIDTDRIIPARFMKCVCLLYTSPSPRDRG